MYVYVSPPTQLSLQIERSYLRVGSGLPYLAKVTRTSYYKMSIGN